MKTMKAIPSILLAGVLVTGAACTSTSTSGSSEKATANTTGTRTGTDMNPTSAPDANSGSAAGASGSDASADATTFMNTFATMQDPVFLMNAASSNMMEVRAGQMAYQKATTPEVRKFAQMMLSQHMGSLQELKAVAAPLGVQIPTTMMPVHQAMADQLMGKRGKDFDATYMDLMATAHKMDIAMFEVKSKAAENPSVQAFATKTLPMLHSHETMASGMRKM